MGHEIRPETIHAALVRVAGDGQRLDTASRGAQDAGESLSGAFGTADVAESAFTAFWADRSDTGEWIANILMHQASCVADAADAFLEADSTMHDQGQSAVNAITDVTPPDTEY
ncbi:hypothetical protein [Citricoccus alkalitolerans]|uniref:Excreted virulence factor EspC (Type VII ESX diderm) n=1 Tax=Citricoccus alkalitolerans TaxID=246603 RepID=A0ABV8XUS2_9MICC